MSYKREEPELIDLLLVPVYLAAGAVLLGLAGACAVYDKANTVYKKAVRRFRK